MQFPLHTVKYLSVNERANKGCTCLTSTSDLMEYTHTYPIPNLQGLPPLSTTGNVNPRVKTAYTNFN